MLRIDDRLGSYAIAAGEAWIMSVQMKRMQGSSIIDWSQRRLVLSFYENSRALFTQIEGVYTSDATGAYFAFVRDGRFSELLFGKQLQVELAERLLEGRAIIATGPLTVAPSASGVLSFGSAIGRVDARFTLYFGTTGLIDLIEQELLPYGGNPVTPAPVITSPAAINSDGTPQVGEVLTGVDPVVTYGSVTARRWLLGSTTLATTQTYTPTATGDHRFQADIKGADGSTVQSTATITVAAATVPAPSFTVQPSISGTPQVGQTLTGNSGTITNGSVSARQWLRDGVAISGATAATYALVTADAGKAVTFRVTAAGGGGSTDATSAAVTVAAAPTAVSITGTPPTTGQVGTPYSFTPSVANGSGTKTFTLSSGTLLGGLSFNTATGAITGTPTVAGTMSGLVVTVTDSTGSASTTATSVVIASSSAAPVTIALAGSSSPYRYVNDFAGTVNNAVTVSTDGTTFTTLTAGRFGMDLGNAIVAATGRPVRYVGGGVQGTTLAAWASDSSVDRKKLAAAMKAAGACDFALIQVGFNDVNQGTNTITYANQLALYRKLITLLRSESGFPNLQVILNPSQDSPSYPTQMALERMAEMTIVNSDANVMMGFSGFDLATFDNIHQTTASAGIAAQRFLPQALAVITGSAQKRGPALLSTTPISTTQTRVTIKHGAGTDITPTSGITGFSVFDSGGAALAISAADRESATTILLTHASTGGNSASLYYSPNAGATDDATQVHDNSALALPMEASASALAIAATGGTTPLTVSGTPGAATVGRSYSYTPTASGGSGTKTWSASGTALPAGLSIASATGAITGTPTAAGSANGIIITVTDASGSASQTVSITVAAAAASRTAKVAFGRETTNIPSSFNNFLAGTSQAQNNNLGISLNLNDTAGSPTGWRITTATPFNAAQDNNGITTTGDTGAYPNAVSIRNWYNGNANAGDNGGVSTPTTTLDITGLNPAKTYAFKVAGFRGAADRKVIYTIGGTSITIDAGTGSADSNVANFSAIAPDSNGKISLTFARASGYSFGYLSVLEIYES